MFDLFSGDSVPTLYRSGGYRHMAIGTSHPGFINLAFRLDPAEPIVSELLHMRGFSNGSAVLDILVKDGTLGVKDLTRAMDEYDES